MSTPEQPTAPAPNPFRIVVVDISENWVNGDPAWGVEERHEVSEGGDGQHRVLCECGHPTEAEALACAEPRSVEGLARRAFEAWHATESDDPNEPRVPSEPTAEFLWEHSPDIRKAMRAAVYAVVKVLR